MTISHADGSSSDIATKHTFSEDQLDWFRAGSALNLIRQQTAG
jgi:aconitate hydratase